MKTSIKKYISAASALALALAASNLALPAFAADGVSYIKRSWDAEKRVVKEETVTVSGVQSANFIIPKEGDTTLKDMTCVVNDTLTCNGRLTVSGNVDLILADGAKLVLNGGIRTETADGVTTTLNIYGQAAGTGQLEAYSNKADKAGIGGDKEEYGGNVNIHGGKVIAKGGDDAAGIGGGYYRDGGNFTVYGGEVEATGGVKGAGIGGGFAGNGTRDDTEIKIYGGKVTANGGYRAAGIGGGNTSDTVSYSGGGGGNIDVYGGEVTATGGNNGAGIGMGSSGLTESSARPSYLGWITITGGSVTAQGGLHGAGIGGGDLNQYYSGNGCVSIKGGTVTATGGDDGAGIGSGYRGFMVPVTISGGTVVATGGNDAAGIGSEINPSGGTASLEITGGDVTVKGTNDGAGIGPGWTSFAFTRMSASRFTAKITGGRVHITTDDGWAIGTTGDSDDFNDKRYWCKLEIGDKMQVRSERAFQTVEKVAACRYRHEVYIEECDHRDTFGDSGISYEYKDSLVHSASCIYCGSKWTENHDAAGLNGACSKCASDNQLKSAAHCLYFAGPKDESDVPSAGFVGTLVAGDTVSVNTLTWTIHPNGMNAKEFTTEAKDHGLANITLYKGARLNVGLIVKGVSDGVAEAKLTAK